MTAKLRLTNAAPPQRVGRWQAGFAIFALLIYDGVHLGLNVADDSGGGGVADPTSTVTQAMILLTAAALVARYRVQCLRALPALLPFGLLLALAVGSSFWSQAPDVSARRSLTLLTLLLFALYLAAVLGAARACRYQLAAMWIAAIASLAMAAVVPASGFDVGGYARAIRGVFTQKNNLGDAMTCGMLALSFLVLARGRLVWSDGVHAGLSLGMTVLAQSTTALLLSTLILLATLATLKQVRGGVRAGMCLAAAGLAVVALMGVLAFAPDLILDALGKDSTLTGRAAIWEAIGHAVGGPSLLGYGYSAFWLPQSIAVQSIWAELTWPAPSAHSGYYDALLELGVVGVTLLAALALATLVLAFWALAVGLWAEATWTLVLLGVTALFNYDESSLPRPDIHQLQWVFAFLVLAAALRNAAPASRALRPRPDWSPRPGLPRAAG